MEKIEIAITNANYLLDVFFCNAGRIMIGIRR